MAINRDAARTWGEIQRVGQLAPGIDSVNDYKQQARMNAAKVDGYLAEQRTPYLRSEQVLEVHRLLFEDLTTFGGKPSQIQMSHGPNVGAPPKNFKKELELLDKQMALLWHGAENQEDRIRALAFQHTRLAAIHGFPDGNGRTARIVTDYGFSRMGLSKSADIDRKDYIDANNTAIAHSNIGRISQVMARQYGADYSGPGFPGCAIPSLCVSGRRRIIPEEQPD